MDHRASSHLILRSYRHAYLLGALVAMVFVRPFLASDSVGLGLLDVLLTGTLIGAVAVSARSRITLGAAVAVALVVVVSRIFTATEASPRAWATVFLVSMIVFNLGVALLVLWDILRSGRRVTADTMLGAVSAYLLIGVAWACGFALLELFAPGSFDFGARQQDESREQFWTFLGFSYTTLTTLGYGNVAPVSARADSLATAEAIVGQFYVAVLVGRLVALQLATRETPPPGPSPGS